MRLLLDTHIALWATYASAALPARARDLLCDPDTIAFFSAVSIWEIAIKHQLRRRGAGAMPMSGREAMHAFLDIGLQPLPVSPGHAAAVDDLPPHHADPFDRLLLAQAEAEPLRLLTTDRAIAAYGGMVLAV